MGLDGFSTVYTQMDRASARRIGFLNGPSLLKRDGDGAFYRKDAAPSVRMSNEPWPTLARLIFFAAPAPFF